MVRYGDPDAALPHLVCVGIEGVEAEPVLLALNQHGVAVHSGSSCSSETLEPSPVLQAMGVDADRSLRASVGWCSTDADVEQFAGVPGDRGAPSGVAYRMIPATRINHAVLYVRDAQASGDFY